MADLSKLSTVLTSNTATDLSRRVTSICAPGRTSASLWNTAGPVRVSTCPTRIAGPNWPGVGLSSYHPASLRSRTAGTSIVPSAAMPTPCTVASTPSDAILIRVGREGSSTGNSRGGALPSGPNQLGSENVPVTWPSPIPVTKTPTSTTTTASGPAPRLRPRRGSGGRERAGTAHGTGRSDGGGAGGDAPGIRNRSRMTGSSSRIGLSGDPSPAQRQHAQSGAHGDRRDAAGQHQWAAGPRGGAPAAGGRALRGLVHAEHVDRRRRGAAVRTGELDAVGLGLLVGRDRHGADQEAVLRQELDLAEGVGYDGGLVEVVLAAGPDADPVSGLDAARVDLDPRAVGLCRPGQEQHRRRGGRAAGDRSQEHPHRFPPPVAGIIAPITGEMVRNGQVTRDSAAGCDRHAPDDMTERSR